MDPEEIVEIPIDGVLDLHTFQAGEIQSLLPEYLALCRQKDILQVRIIHGKGRGALRRTVHSLLERLQEVSYYKLAGNEEGGWGATLVTLKPQETTKEV
jgi:DNA-nicking Smr family endonuclease